MRLIIILSLLLLSGCGTSLFNTAGQAHYTYSKCDGDVCTEIDILNTKDIKTLNGSVEISPDGTVKINLDETDSNGSGLAEINANNQGKFLDALKLIIPK